MRARASISMQLHHSVPLHASFFGCYPTASTGRGETRAGPPEYAARASRATRNTGSQPSYGGTVASRFLMNKTLVQFGESNHGKASETKESRRH